MSHNDMTLIDPRDVAAATGLLSRLPVPVDTDLATRRGARGAWAYPIAGLAIGIVAASVGQIAIWLGLGPMLVAGLVIATLVVITGALHEDGLSDAADGLWGGWTAERRLEIMKDSRIGAYGVLALMIVVALRWQALGGIIQSGALWGPVLAVAIASRAPMVWMMAALPNARDNGLSHSVGRPSLNAAYIALTIGVVASLFVAGGLVGVIWVAGTTAAIAMIARTKIDGQTGDILGATQQVSEVVLLLAISVALT